MKTAKSHKIKLLILSLAAMATTIVPSTRHLLLLPIAAMATMEISCDSIPPEHYT